VLQLNPSGGRDLMDGEYPFLGNCSELYKSKFLLSTPPSSGISAPKFAILVASAFREPWVS